MPSNITLITLGVEGVAEATAFYERLSLVKAKRASEASVSFFKAGGVVLALWSREAQREDGQAGAIWNRNGDIAVAQNVASDGEVDAVMARAKAAGARILKQAAKAFWGGYKGYFADPDGHLWEVAFNPKWGLPDRTAGMNGTNA